MIEYLRDPKTGYLYAYKDGVLKGPIMEMGGNPPKEPSEDLWKREHEKGKK